MGKRKFDELHVVPSGVQSFEDRFGKRRRYENDDIPLISQWRCNLTGLSQLHNLYFVGYGREIYVYVPQYPTQRIAERPSLIVSTPPSSAGLPGHIDPRDPHTINNLIVEHLGNEEVVATVRDDGDVDAVLVRHVVQAMERRAEPGNTIGVVADEVKPVFQSNVGISAWGLAIHSNARILATSSNAHEVRIFKFGLLHEDAESPFVHAEESITANDAELSAAAGRTHIREERKMDVTIRVINGDANIPHIAFCNTGDDPEARWLLTTDVSGYCRIMDLHNSQDRNVTVQQFRFGRSLFGHGGGFDRLNAGWAVMFLDTRSFRSDAFRSALGLARDDLPGIQGNGNNRSWDLSDTVDELPSNSRAFVHHEQRKRRPAQPWPSSLGQTAVTATSSPSVVEADVLEVEMSDAASIVPSDGLDTVQDAPEEDEEEQIHSDHDDELVSDDDPDFEGTEDTVAYHALYGGKRIFANQPYFYYQSPLCQDMPCPILHASVKNIYLLQPSNQKHHPGPFAPPMVGLANPLRQAVQNQSGYLNMFDRLNMNAYIPSLGVVVLASQKGRALIVCLTKLPASVRCPPGVRDDRAAKTDYTMRVECILPFAEQEKANQRPFAPLHGIAVGPIQGTENCKDERKRWRLMMHYQDHSVLSYEIGRPRARDSVIEVDSLLV